MTAFTARDINGGNPSNNPCAQCDHSLYMHTTSFIMPDGSVLLRDYCRQCKCPAYISRATSSSTPAASTGGCPTTEAPFVSSPLANTTNSSGKAQELFSDLRRDMGPATSR